MAGQKPARYLPFHTRRLILAQPGGDLVRSNNSSSHPTRYVRIGHSTDQKDQGLHCPLERRCEAVRVDRHRRRDSRKGQDRPGERQETGRQQLKVNWSALRDTETLMRLRLGPPRWWSGWWVTSRSGEGRLAGLG